RVVPDVEDVFGIVRPGNAPFDGLAADGDIFQPCFHETADFIQPKIRLDELRLVLIKVEQAVLVGRKPEEVVFFGDQFGRAAADLTVGRLGRIADVKIVVNAVAAFVFGFVDRARRALHGAANEGLDCAGMFGRGGANEVGDGYAEEFPKIAKNLFVAVNELLRSDALGFGGTFDIDAVLVRASEIGYIVTAHALVARDYVTNDGGVGRADVGTGVRVVDRGGEVELRLVRHERSDYLALFAETERGAAEKR